MAAQALPAGYAVQEYRVEKLLGVGGFGLTYLAIDANLNLRVALKEYLPGNIYIRDDGSPVLLDFGSARQKNQELTAIVTPGYAPFEQYHSQGKQGPWSDLYALAGVLYWMVTGNRPLDAAARVREDSLPPAVHAADRDRYRPAFLAAIDWGLAPHEDHRPQSVREWR